ncbi:MAG: hypothetical protein RLZZ303_2457 [Candidatus Hydrogenedentota bacterium]
MARLSTARILDSGAKCQQERADTNAAALREALPAETLAQPGFDERAIEFADSNETQRQSWVNDRSEAVIICDGTGRVLDAYKPDTDLSVCMIADYLMDDRTVLEQLRDLYQDPALAGPVETLENALQAGYPMDILWPQPLARPGQQVELFQVRLRRLTGHEQERRMFFLRRSVWETWGRTYRPNVHVTDGFEWSADELPTYVFGTNTYGFRGGDVSVPKPKGVYRIVCLGGSTTAEGPTDELTYPALLQERLRDHFRRNDIEVVNAGRHGSSVANEADSIDDILSLEPDLVLHYNFVNDYRSMACSIWSRPGETRSFSAWCRSYLYRSHLLRRLLGAWLMPSRAEIRVDMKDFVTEPLHQIATQLRANDVEVGLMSFSCPSPSRENMVERAFFEYCHYRWLFERHLNGFRGYAEFVDLHNETLREIAAKTGAQYLPVAEALNQHTALFTDICHLNLEGIQRKAEIVAGLVIERFTLAPSNASTLSVE